MSYDSGRYVAIAVTVAPPELSPSDLLPCARNATIPSRASCRPVLFNLLRSDDTDARWEARRCFGRSDRSAQLPDAPRTCTYDARCMIHWIALGVAVHGVGSLESGDFDSRRAIARREGAMAPTEPSRTTMSRRPARRCPGRRHRVTTLSLGSVDWLPMERPCPRCPEARSLRVVRCSPRRRKTREWLDITLSMGSS
jgi:hypothetical protein